MIQRAFAQQLTKKIKDHPDVLGLAAGGSWTTNEIDAFSDLDLVLVTRTKISADKERMIAMASGFGKLLNAFTGEHVGEPRLLICMYDDPFLHVDIKFVTLEEFRERVEDPEILWELGNLLTGTINETKPNWPEMDFQWIEDRFWTWIHYIALKIGRGELFEALDSISYLRMHVLSPLLLMKNGHLPRGLRKVEFDLEPGDLEKLKETVADYNVSSIVVSLQKCIGLYHELREALYTDSIVLNELLEKNVNNYLSEIKLKVSP
jgi:hypothetical protein